MVRSNELDVGVEGWDDAVLPDALPACKGPHHSLEVSEMDGDRKREIEEKLHECVERKPMDVVIATTGVLVDCNVHSCTDVYVMDRT